MTENDDNGGDHKAVRVTIFGEDYLIRSEMGQAYTERCVACHGTAGGWDATTWAAAVGSGDHAPVVIPGDATNSILAQMMLGTHPEGVLMPPDGKLPDALVQLVVDWIDGGALE